MKSFSVLILTYNEEANISTCLQSVLEWTDGVFVLDSFSKDRTKEIAEQLGAKVIEHAWEGYAAQRNWALKNIPFSNEWVFVLDADERPSEELKEELKRLFSKNSQITENGFYIKRKFLFLGKWIRHGGYYPVWLLRLFRYKKAQCEMKLMDEHYIVEGSVGRLENDILHEDVRGVSFWIEKHNTYTGFKAKEWFESKISRNGKGNEDMDTEQRQRLAKKAAWDRLPLFIRPFLYFFFCYVIRLGFLDGGAGFIYHVLRNFWYPFLIDVKILEILRSKDKKER